MAPHNFGARELIELREDTRTRIEVFNSDLIASLSAHGVQEECLVCVVGMPRSGTTLVEQLLSTQNGICTLGERPEFYWITQGMQHWVRSRERYPLCCRRLSPEIVRRVSETVRTQLQSGVSQSTRVVTKLPIDLWNLGLIKVLFPRVRIIHCHRHPIDTCLSCYMQNFATIPFANTLVNLAEVYWSYRQIVRHWRALFGPSEMLDVSYEQVVADPETVVRNICNFCGITLNGDWIRFHTRVRRVDTASMWQVRRPIYRTSVGKWMNYRPFLGPLLDLEER